MGIEADRRLPPQGDLVTARIARTLVRDRAEMFSERKAHLLITKKPEFFDLKVLGVVVEGKVPPWWMPSYDPKTGEVVTNRWNPASLKLTEDKKHHAVEEAEDYEILRHPKWRVNVDLNKLPKSWEVEVFVPQRIPTIEGALRQADGIRHDYAVKSGPEFVRLEELYVVFNQVSDLVVRGKIGKMDLPNLSIEIADRLEEQGLEVARDPLWRDLTQTFLEAFDEHPSGRYYPLAVRMKMFKAMRNLVKLEVETMLTKKKADRVFNVLFVEREGERLAIEEALGKIELVGGFAGSKGEPIFYKEVVSDDEITQTRYQLKDARESLARVRVAPYFFVARLAEAMLGSHQFRYQWEIDNLFAILEQKELEFVLDEDSVEDLLMKRRAGDAHRRLGYVYTLLDEVLEDPDNDEITVFD